MQLGTDAGEIAEDQLEISRQLALVVEAVRGTRRRIENLEWEGPPSRSKRLSSGQRLYKRDLKVAENERGEGLSGGHGVTSL